jgi:hypothetical protein
MNTNLRIGTALLATLLACGLVACTSSEAPQNGTGGSIVPVGTGGAIGTGGTTVTTTPPAGLGTLCPPPAQLITDFTVAVDAGTSSADVRFGGNGFLSGGGSYFPNSGANAIKQDLTQGNWHLSGTVGDYTGMGLYFDNCDRVDASQFKGISFTISGTVANGNAITMAVNTVGDTPTGTWMLANGKTTAKATDAGRCTPSSNTNNQYYTPGCTAPSISIPVTATPTPVTVTWAQLVRGLPDSTPNPTEITSIAWSVPWTDPAGSTPTKPYAIDIVMDDLALIP